MPTIFRSLSTTQLIKSLQTSSGAGMMECKQALLECGNNLDEALDWLRKYGSAKATQKTAGRENSEGQVSVLMKSDYKSCTTMTVKSETDFASRSDLFTKFVEDVTNRVNTNTSSTTQKTFTEAELLAMTDVKTCLDEAMVSIRENLQLSSATQTTVQQESNFLNYYIHNKAPSSDWVGQIAAIVEIASSSPSPSPSPPSPDQLEIGRKLAMHVAAAKPSYATIEQIPTSTIEKEKEIMLEQMKDTNKPPEVMEKIVNGKLRKFYEENVLEEQGHMVEAENPKIKSFLKSQGLSLVNFVLHSIK